MNNEKPKSMFEGLIDSVIGTGQFLWDFLGDPPTKKSEPKTETPRELDAAPSVLDMFASSPPKSDGQIPAQVVDTEGESEDA